MNRIQLLFLEALKASLENRIVEWDQELTGQDWSEFFALAEKHHVLPMVYEVVYKCPAAQAFPQMLAILKQKMIQQVMMQTMRTSSFLALYRTMNKNGIHPLVVKGLICRSLYPNPDYRMSSDEDLLVSKEAFAACHQLMMESGMQVLDDTEELEEAFEIPYGRPGSPLYIELHKLLFSPKSEAYGNLNDYFQNVHEDKIALPIDGVQIYTMSYTDHLFYLICHSFKHFLHSGFGIRQVCDIILFANAYGDQIDWQQILANCKEIRAEYFAAAMFQIGKKYLTFDWEKACYPKNWQQLEVDESMMLLELLDSGVFGNSSMSRKHSSNITLDAVSAQKNGKKGSSGLLRSLFPDMEYMKRGYPYLEKAPYLLPIAWGQRVLRYRKEAAKNQAIKNAAEAMKIGAERVELMKQYGILK